MEVKEINSLEEENKVLGGDYLMTPQSAVIWMTRFPRMTKFMLFKCFHENQVNFNPERDLIYSRIIWPDKITAYIMTDAPIEPQYCLRIRRKGILPVEQRFHLRNDSAVYVNPPCHIDRAIFNEALHRFEVN